MGRPIYKNPLLTGRNTRSASPTLVQLPKLNEKDDVVFVVNNTLDQTLLVQLEIGGLLVTKADGTPYGVNIPMKTTNVVVSKTELPPLGMPITEAMVIRLTPAAKPTLGAIDVLMYWR